MVVKLPSACIFVFSTEEEKLVAALQPDKDPMEAESPEAEIMSPARTSVMYPFNKIFTHPFAGQKKKKKKKKKIPPLFPPFFL